MYLILQRMDMIIIVDNTLHYIKETNAPISASKQFVN